MQLVPTPKSTPSRRRPPPGRSRSGAQKVYASENDVPSYKPDDAAGSCTPLKHTPQPQTTSQKQKNKANRNRGASGGVAPSGRRRDHESPSLPVQAASAPIFAGSTFHASPAPSALPLPSFLGLSSNDSPTAKPKTTESAYESSPLTDSDESTPAGDPIPRNDESPLELFFRADRAEKARVRRASSANLDGTADAAPSPVRNSSHKEGNTFSKTMPHSAPRRPMFPEGNASPNPSSNDPQGISRLRVGPAFSTPYHERIRAARQDQNSTQSTPTTNRALDPSSSEALKRYLFTGQLHGSDPHGPSPHPRSSSEGQQFAQQRPWPGSGQQQNVHQGSQRAPFPTSNIARGLFPPALVAGHEPRAQFSPPIHANAESSPRSEQIIALEGDLRRVLKLDPLH
ncbi:hypothetical protein F4777DRAFT_589378 [Nemania sp. FL0916]|nr:hypothetical protein F4777DRAFT_589378 [Nemania sp. FL0916]